MNAVGPLVGDIVVPISARTVIQMRGGELHVYAAQAEKILAREVYVRGQGLVRVGFAPEISNADSHGIERESMQTVIVPVSSEYVRRRCTELADFQKYHQRDKRFIAVDCPKDLATNITGMGSWEHFKPLEGVATAPFLRADGTVCERAGYDEASRVMLAPSQHFPPVPEYPTKDDAKRALNTLLAPFAEFPFAEGAQAAFAAHILTAVTRHALDVSPVFIYTAPVAGTGKTLLAGMPSRISSGTSPALHPYVDSTEEMRKVLFSALLVGDTELLFDNVPTGHRVRSPVLCGFATASVYSDRRLGVSELKALPNRCTVALTGNNMNATGDLARRSIMIRLDANSESASGRSFKIADLANHVARQRAQLLVAALTIVRAYVVAGYPVQGLALPSFERWSRLVRDPLLWLGQADPVGTQESDGEDELAPLREAFIQLSYLRQPFTARDLATNCVGNAILKDAVAVSGCQDPIDAQKIGYWLRENKDRVAGNWKLQQDVLKHKTASWKVVAPTKKGGMGG